MLVTLIYDRLYVRDTRFGQRIWIFVKLHLTSRSAVKYSVEKDLDSLVQVPKGSGDFFLVPSFPHFFKTKFYYCGKRKKGKNREKQMGPPIVFTGSEK